MTLIQTISQNQLQSVSPRFKANPSKQGVNDTHTSKADYLENVPEEDVVEFSELKALANMPNTVTESQVEQCRDKINYIKDKKGSNYTMVRDDGMNIYVKNSFWKGRKYTGTLNNQNIDLKYKSGGIFDGNKGKLVGKINDEDVCLDLQFGFHRIQFDENIPENVKNMLPELALIVVDELEKRQETEQNITEFAAFWGAIK